MRAINELNNSFMKTIRTYIYATVVLAGLAACSSDLEKVRYDEDASRPAVLAALRPAYTLDASQADEPAFTLAWQKPRMNYPASVTSDVQADVAGNGFAGARTLASTRTDSLYVLSTADLNGLVRDLQQENGLETGALQLEFRLVSTLSVSLQPLYSNTVTTAVTPYAE